MKLRIALLAFLLFTISAIAAAQTGPPPDPYYLQGTSTVPASATGNGNAPNIAYYGGAVVQVVNAAGTFTITWEGTLDGTNYAVQLRQVSGPLLHMYHEVAADRVRQQTRRTLPRRRTVRCPLSFQCPA